jgi:hypothetical protein
MISRTKEVASSLSAREEARRLWVRPGVMETKNTADISSGAEMKF